MSIKQNSIRANLHAQMKIDPKREIKTRIAFLKEYLIRSRAQGFVLGISGGQDSTLAGKLAQMAISELNEKQEYEHVRFIGVQLPYGEQFDSKDAKDAMEFIQPSISYTINIK